MALIRTLKNTLKTVAVSAGYEITPAHWPAASQYRPVGRLVSVLEDIKARGLQLNHIVDIGANEGDWSREVAMVFPQARFYLLEPVPVFKPALDAFVLEHPGSKYFPVGAGPEDTTMSIYVENKPDGSATGGSTFLADAKPAEMFLPVPVRSLDSLIEAGEVEIPDLIKIDVQGFELEVCKGALTKCFGATELFILETSLYRFWGTRNPLIHEVIAFMVDHNYVCYDLVEFHRRALDGSLGQVDILFCRADSFLRSSNQWDPPPSP